MNILSFTFSARNSLAYIKGYFRIPQDHYNKNEKKEISDPNPRSYFMIQYLY
ncbi:MAG: hypothetical protein ACI35Y_09910 [Candidatus Limimorpha sp.]